MSKLRIYSISDKYITFLRKDAKLSNVFDNKVNQRIHTRKYLGIVFQQNGFNYFIPFSSPKESDFYTDCKGERSIKKSIIPIIRMTTFDTVSKKIELKGTLKLSNMIPVPVNELIFYNINAETDLNYKSIVTKEYEFIRSNVKLITKNANILYKQKTKPAILYQNQPIPNYLHSTIDFTYAEIRCKAFIEEQID